MSARTTPDRRGSATSSPPLYPAPPITPAAALAAAAGAAPAPEAPPHEASESTAPESTALHQPVGEPPSDSRETRRAMRTARRIRRQVMVGCALVIAVCLILTILIVTIARGRRPGSGVVVPGVALAARAGPAPATSTAATPLTVRPHIVNPDAAASEGEHR